MALRSLVGACFNKVIKILPQNYLEWMFYQIGQILEVRSFACERKLGLFEGSINDKGVHKYYLKYGTWALGLQYIIGALFANGPGTFIDVGANIGLVSIPLAMSKDNINIFSFEPETNNYRFLRKNIINNDVEAKIKTFNLALFSKDCSLEMELSADNMGDHRVRSHSVNSKHSFFNEEVRPTITIQARKLDHVLQAKELIKPIILKVDTQGAEVQVFSGAAEVLAAVDYLLVEYWPYGLQRMGDSIESFFNIIKQFPWGAVYDDNVPSMPKLRSISEFILYLDSLLEKSSQDHLDILLSRYPILPV